MGWGGGSILEALHRRGPPRLYTREEVTRLGRDWRRRSSARLVGAIKQKSMLHQETLSLLHYFAGRVRGAILEIGPYTGGSTMAMATAIHDVPLITIEMGGVQAHPHLPSTDILADLDANLREMKVRDRVTIIAGFSNAPETIRAVESNLAGRRIDLLFVDADGEVGRDFAIYREFLADRAIIVCDDYETSDPVAREKQGPVREFVTEAIASGLLRDLGVFRWGTWFGQYLAE